MSNDKKNIVLIGGGGHCTSVIDVIEQEGNYNIFGILDQDKKGEYILNYPIIGGDEQIPNLVKQNFEFLVTVGQIKSPKLRQRLAMELSNNKAKIATVISPTAYVSKHAHVGEGTVVFNGAFINANAKVGKNCIINTKAIIEHDAIIEDFCHISTASVVNGHTTVKKGTFLGSNAVLSHNIIIEEDSIISAGQFIK